MKRKLLIVGSTTAFLLMLFMLLVFEEYIPFGDDIAPGDFVEQDYRNIV